MNIKKFIISSSARWFDLFTTAIFSIIAVPIMLSKWSVETYAAWILLMGITTYVNMPTKGLNTYIFSKYKSLSPDSLAAVKFYTSAINGLDDKDVRLSKRVSLPSSKLRGFKQVGPKDVKDYVGGNYAASTNLELSLPNLLPEDTNTDISLFLDFGSVWGVDYDSSVDDSSKIRSSTGINTSWMSPLGPMSFIFSQNITKANTDSTESFNFRLGTSF